MCASSFEVCGSNYAPRVMPGVMSGSERLRNRQVPGAGRANTQRNRTLMRGSPSIASDLTVLGRQTMQVKAWSSKLQKSGSERARMSSAICECPASQVIPTIGLVGRYSIGTLTMKRVHKGPQAPRHVGQVKIHPTRKDRRCCCSHPEQELQPPMTTT